MSPKASINPAILDAVGEGVYVVDTDRKIVFWNRSAERITGFSREEVLGFDCSQNILNHVDEDGNNLCLNGCPLQATIQDGEERQARVFLTHKNGHRVPVNVKSVPLLNDLGQIVGAVETFTDASDLQHSLAQIEQLQRAALLDPLTGVGNRRFLRRELKKTMDELERYETPSAVVMADIDHFKHVNDTYGHELGDRVLTMVAATMQNSLRPSDTIGRWGGEEFLLILPNVGSEPELKTMLERLRRLVAASQLRVGSEFVRVTISFGATLLVPGDTADNAVNRADQAMYESKRNGRDQVTVG